MNEPHSSTKRRTARGFTLVEVLVAMMIMAIMAVMAWQGVDGIVRARTASQERLERTLRLNTVVAQWEQDLASIEATSVVSPALSCDGASVRLTRRTPTGIQVVAWTLRPDASGSTTNGTLERWAGPSVRTTGELQDSWLRSLQLQGGEPGLVRTLSGLSQWQTYFYRGNSWSNCQSTDDKVLGDPSRPNAVRLILSFAPGSGLNGELVRDVRLDL